MEAFFQSLGAPKSKGGRSPYEINFFYIPDDQVPVLNEADIANATITTTTSTPQSVPGDFEFSG